MPKAISFSFHPLRFADRNLDCSQSPIFPWDRNWWVWLAAILVSWWERNCGEYKISVGTGGRVNSIDGRKKSHMTTTQLRAFLFQSCSPVLGLPGLLLLTHYVSIVRYYVMKKHLYFICAQLLRNKETTVAQALPWHLPCNSNVTQPTTSWFWSCHVSRT